MTGPKLLTFDDLINELNMGKATLKFILSRFNQWLATEVVNNETLYTRQAASTLLTIRKYLDAGMLPEQVETSLEQDVLRTREQEIPSPSQSDSDVPLGPVNQEMVLVFQNMFQTFIEKQDRIASAQENLARVEDRKAAAMEKRAAAEDKKADAMTSIALALQELNQRASAPQAMEIAGRAVETLALDEMSNIDESLPGTSPETDSPSEQDPGDTFENLSSDQLFEAPLPMESDFGDQDIDAFKDFSDSELDDLSSLVNDNALAPEDIDDLSFLIDAVSDTTQDLDDLASLVSFSASPPEMADLDDLSKLVDDTASSPEQDAFADLDDLSLLVDPVPAADSDTPAPMNENQADEDIDDLFSLVGMAKEPQTVFHEGLDDLSMLIEQPPSAGTEEKGDHAGDLDDLSALISTGNQTPTPLDDLSQLVAASGQKPESSATKPQGAEPQMDDLSALLPGAGTKSPGPGAETAISSDMDDLSSLLGDNNTEQAPVPPEENTAAAPSSAQPPQPSLKPDITPEQDLAKYKAAVMKIIIKLKNQGLTAQQTTDRLNNDQVATLSGKPTWRVKAIEKIYGFIDSAK